MEWYQYPLIPIIIPLISYRRRVNERTTSKFLEQATIDSCIHDLDGVLEQLSEDADISGHIFDKFATTDKAGRSIWNETCFARYICVKLAGHEETSMRYCPLLWRIFTFAAHYPFSAETHDKTEDVFLEFQAFRRAYSLLVLRGYELIGAIKPSDGLLAHDLRETKYQEKVPRLSRIVFRSLSTAPPIENDNLSSDNMKTVASLHQKDIEEVLYLVQPPMEEVFPLKCSIESGHFEEVASRLRLEDEQRDSADLATYVSRADVQDLVQLILSVRVEDKRWRNALRRSGPYNTEFQRSGHVQYTSLDLRRLESADCRELASAYIASHFSDGEEFVRWGALEAWLQKDVSPLRVEHLERLTFYFVFKTCFIFLFFHLWAFIFGPANINIASPDTNNASLPTNIINFMFISNIAKFHTDNNLRSRFHNNELRFYLDLQASKLVTSSTTSSALEVDELYNILTLKNWYSILVFHGPTVDITVQDKEQLFAVFIHPAEIGMEIWRTEGGLPVVEYIWQSSMIQMLPASTRNESGGMIADLEPHGRIRLRSRDDSLSVMFNAKHKIVHVEQRPDVAEGMEVMPMDMPTDDKLARISWSMELTRWECYRLPGETYKVTRWPSVIQPST